MLLRRELPLLAQEQTQPSNGWSFETKQSASKPEKTCLRVVWRIQVRDNRQSKN